jgi:hypothetical protein
MKAMLKMDKIEIDALKQAASASSRSAANS